MKFLIEVYFKKKEYDAKARRLHDELKNTEHPCDAALATAQLYSIEGDVASKDIKKIGELFLCDPVVERFAVRGDDHVGHYHGSYVVDVWLKPGVTDTVGETIVRGVKTLGIKNPVTVKTGERYIIPSKNISMKTVEDITKQLLANTVIHDFMIRKIK